MSENAKFDHPFMSNTISTDSVYNQLYNEMRRCRDYEFSSSMWYTAILLAIVSFVLYTRFGQASNSSLSVMISRLEFKIIIIVISVAIAAASSYLVYYSYEKYKIMRKWTDRYLEPEWKKSTFNVKERRFTPRHIYWITQWLLVVVITLLLFIKIN
jgi:hypothetical protein